jgi:hypothetical protein
MKKILIGALLLSSLAQSQTYTCTCSLMPRQPSGNPYWDNLKINNQTLNHPLPALEPAGLYYPMISNTPAQNIHNGSNQFSLSGYNYSSLSAYPTRFYSLYLDLNSDQIFTADEIIIPSTSFNANWSNSQITVNNNFTITQSLLTNQIYNMRLVIAWSGDTLLTNPCTATQTNAVVVDFSVGYQTLSNQQYHQESLPVYPNPSSGLINLGASSSLRYQVFDTEGRVVLEGGGVSIDVSELTVGMYMLRTEDDNLSVAMTKIIKN